MSKPELERIVGLPVDQRLSALVELGRRYVDSSAAVELTQPWIQAAIDLIGRQNGTAADRVALGELVGQLGDPRLRRPSDRDYWASISTEDGMVQIGKFPVTNAEYKAWIDSGGYAENNAWSEEGRNWRDRCTDPWSVRSQAEDAAPFVVPNQPVVGVTWYEADAFARAHGARLPRFDERLQAVRGEAKRPYPWGEPFGEGNANTKEEVLWRPCAVGLYPRDCTPEGVWDLAGNVAEWVADRNGAEYWFAPGAWNEPSMASWAKARDFTRPDSHWTALGFRLAKDAL